MNKRQRIPKGQATMDNPETLATQGTQDEENQTKHNAICVGHNKTQNNMCQTQQNTTQYVLDTTKHNTICVGHNKTQYVLDTTKHNTICVGHNKTQHNMCWTQ